MKPLPDCQEILLNCPICSGTKFEFFLKCKDYTVSGELFEIDKCFLCGFKFTNPRVKENNISAYYQSQEYISHSNNSRGFINTLYKWVRKVTIAQKTQLINSISSSNGKSILDFGSGTGHFLQAMNKKGWNTLGIEPGIDARKFSINSYNLNVIEPIEIKKIESEEFDVITLWHVLEHIHQLNETIEDFKRTLKETGKIIIAVPNSNSFDAQFYKAYWAAYDLPRHLYHFNPEVIEKLFSNHGMKVVKVYPLFLDVFYISMLSEKYKKNLFGILKGLFNGFFFSIKASWFKSGYSSQIYVIEKIN